MDKFEKILDVLDILPLFNGHSLGHVHEGIDPILAKSPFFHLLPARPQQSDAEDIIQSLAHFLRSKDPKLISPLVALVHKKEPITKKLKRNTGNAGFFGN